MTDRDLQASFLAVADSVPVLIWLSDGEGGFTFVNRRWLEFTGRTLDQDLGHGWEDNVHPEDRARCTADHSAAIRRGEPFELELRLRRADGVWRWVLARAVPLAGGFVGSAIDLTERREAEEALAHSREQLAAAMAAGRMGTFDLELATGRVSRDPNLELLYGLEPGAAATFDEWAELIHPDDRLPLLAEVARVTAEGGEYRMEHRLVRPDGEVRWVERRGHAYSDADGNLAGLRGTVVDITERRESEEQRSTLLERVTRLQAITAALARAGTPDEVLEIMVKEGVDATGASAGSVAVLDASGTALDVARAGGYPAALLEQFRRMELAATVPLAQAARTATPVVCADVDEWSRRFPDLVAHSSRIGHRAAAAFPLKVDGRVIGAVGLSFDDPQPFDAPQVEFLTAVVAQCAQAMDRAWAYAAEARAHRSAEEARARLALLAEASIVLAGSLEYEGTLPDVARLAVPILGDCCMVDVLGDRDGAGDGWRRVAVASADADVEDALLALPLFASPTSDLTGHDGALDGLGLGSALVVPLEARRRTLGMLVLGRRRTDAFTDADRRLAEGLATRMAQAVDNAGLYRAERRAHRDAETAAARLQFLLDVSTTLAAPMEPDERLERLARQAADAVCDLCIVDLVDRDGAIRRVAAVAAVPELQPAADALLRLEPADPQGSQPSAAAIRGRRSELCPTLTEDRLRSITTSDAHLEAARQVGALSYLAVPLLGLRRVLGAVTLVTTSRSSRHYGAADLALAEDMAWRVAMGLERAWMHEEMRRVAQTLQSSLLPSVPPVIPGLEVGTRYMAAEEGTVVGGDFYDVFALGDESWAVVVGDVCGQGVEAAVVTGLARHTVRSSALEHDSPAAVLSHLNEVLLTSGPATASETDPRFCTVCLARLDVTAGGATVTLAMGGHPLPYVLGADGSVRQIGRPGSLIGVVPHATVADEEHRLAPGDALVLYTDGISERHQGASFFGERGIEETLSAAAGFSADAIAGLIEDAARRFVDDQPSDDMAVVVVRVPPR
ncbi:MAG TPA: SpoIIE family protein phosphatase [Acidimicrobiales bacterium]|nr:SpoIIE family protein phosphatase [Acidimicrobiales bacterium]